MGFEEDNYTPQDGDNLDRRVNEFFKRVKKDYSKLEKKKQKKRRKK